MATLFQIKRSAANAAPSTLQSGELAYSFNSDKIFIGNSTNAVLTIGGKYYTDVIDAASASNGASTLVKRYANGRIQIQQAEVLAYPTANLDIATKEYVDNVALGSVSLDNLTDVTVVGSSGDQNNRILLGQANGQYVTTSVTGNVTISNTGVVVIGSSQVTNSMLAGSITNDKLQNNSVTINGVGGISGGGSVSLGGTLTLNTDSVYAQANAAYAEANTKLPLAGGTITGSLNVAGNFTVTGNTTFVDVTTLNISDPLIYLAANNLTTDIVDIGFVGSKNTSGTLSQSGFVRHAADGIYYLFDNYTEDSVNNVINVANTTYALLRANIEAESINIGGNAVATAINTSAAYGQANSAYSQANAAYEAANSASALGANTVTVFANSAGAVEKVSLNFNNTATVAVSVGAGTSGNANLAFSVRSTSITNDLLQNTSVSLNGANGVIAGTATLGGSLTLAVAAGDGILNVGGVVAVDSTVERRNYTANAVLYGSNSTSLGFATGSEGNVLQISSGIPAFGMLDGGSF